MRFRTARGHWWTGITDPSPNGNDNLDRMHVHFGPGAGDPDAFTAFMTRFAQMLADDPALLARPAAPARGL